MKILAIIGVIFAFLALTKIYVYRRVLRHTFIFANHRKLLIFLLALLFALEVGFWFAQRAFKALGMLDLEQTIYGILGGCIVASYCLFVACVVADVLRGGTRILLFSPIFARLRHFVKNIFQSRIFSRFSTQAKSQESASQKSIGAESGGADSIGAKSANLDSAKMDSATARPAMPNPTAQNTAPATSRRRFLKILYDLGVFALFFFFIIKSRKNALDIPPVRTLEIPLPRLKTPKTIAMVSDLHIGKTLGASFLQGIIDKINALDADVVVIVGDLVDDDVRLLKRELRLLNDIQSKEGVFYVTGNHEYYHGIEPIMAFLRTLNIRVLENENLELRDFNIAGVHDLAGLRFGKMRPDIQKAAANLAPNKPNILLAHQPKFIRQNDVSAFDLVLCGHTHAGQVFPLSFFVWLDQHYIHGLYELSKKTKLYVSSGAGFWGPSIRFLAPSEIVRLKLIPA
ncbi:hypothetical protein BKN38_07425 [Helicobacter sp. CLO-3]|uniref:metallophosphoesterase n=1 Tax=unclassified Helicobacter TaxID=2593540 RepID=UPI000804D25A|nr:MULTISPECIES: metallophosphoesterase [unclassified Helicobacter]OBV29065.1 hypothetical protein BA723_07065 [Helicobacter sp. CLO-3]OHU82260.1 hypothetical protein BKN38_07425 [Helicobacter sp. CLO-3]